jgi:hypothetical protein
LKFHHSSSGKCIELAIDGEPGKPSKSSQVKRGLDLLDRRTTITELQNLHKASYIFDTTSFYLREAPPKYAELRIAKRRALMHVNVFIGVDRD